MLELPKGNRVMPENLALSAGDLSNAVQNLIQDSFTGYLRFELPASRQAWMFFANGKVLRSFEHGNGATRAYKPERLIGKVAGGSARAASYLLSPRLATPLALSFGFQPLHTDKTVGKKEFKPLLDEFEGAKRSGFIRFRLANREAAVVLDAGEIVSDSFIDNYGDIVCGREAITALLDQVHSEGATVSVFGETRADLDRQAHKLDADLERMIQLTPKSVSGLFAAKDVLKLDFDFLRNWGLPPKTIFFLVVEDLDGRELGIIKTQGAAGKSQILEVPAKILQGWNLAEGQPVQVYPQSE